MKGALALFTLVAIAAAPAPATNRRVATRDAQELLTLLALPRGALPLRVVPPGDSGLLRAPYARPGTPELVDRDRLWRVQDPLGSVVAFVEAKRPRGSRQTQSGRAGGAGVPPNRELTFSFPPIAGRVSTRWLAVTVVALPHGWTAVRGDGEDVWIVPRPPRERIPAGVREIDVATRVPDGPASIRLRVTDPGKVAEIVRWIDALGIVQPGGVYQCPALRAGPTVVFDFRAGAVVPARASVPAVASGPCNPIELTIGGRREAPLVGGSFLERVERLLGVRLGSNRAAARARLR